MAKLKPCPFCGRIPKLEDCGDNDFFVKCDCGIEQSKLYGQRCDAVRHWNRRNGVLVGKHADQMIIGESPHYTVSERFEAHCLNCVECGSYKCTKCDGKMYFKVDVPQMEEPTDDIYPLTVIKDRYTGVYSNGKYTAWNMYFDEISQDIDGDDISCYDFWYSYDGVVGLGRTPNEAIEDLRCKLADKED